MYFQVKWKKNLEERLYYSITEYIKIEVQSGRY